MVFIRLRFPLAWIIVRHTPTPSSLDEGCGMCHLTRFHMTFRPSPDKTQEELLRRITEARSSNVLCIENTLLSYLPSFQSQCSDSFSYLLFPSRKDLADVSNSAANGSGSISGLSTLPR